MPSDLSLCFSDFFLRTDRFVSYLDHLTMSTPESTVIEIEPALYALTFDMLGRAAFSQNFQVRARTVHVSHLLYRLMVIELG